MIGSAIVKILSGLLSGIGGILFFFGFFDSNFSLLAIGIFVMTFGEAFSVYSIKYESKETLHLLKSRFWQDLGSSWAFPVLLFLVYLFTKSSFVLAFSLVLAVLAFFRSLSLVIKVYLVDRKLW